MSPAWPSDRGYPSFRATLAPQVDSVVGVPRDPLLQIELLTPMFEARLHEPVLVDAAAAAAMTRPYSWLLDRVGAGITLTGAGYLPPAHVKAAVTELGLAEEWIGSHNREHDTLPVLELRASAITTGLLRKSSGTLSATRRGLALRNDPAALWWHLAEHVPPRRAARLESQATVLLLTAVAANLAGDPLQFAADWLTRFGYRMPGGAPLGPHDARHCAETAWTVLTRTGSIQGWRRDPATRITPEGSLFARAALRTWPAPNV